MKISVSSYSFQQYLKAGKMTWEEVPEAAHKIGIKGIDFIDLPGETQKERLALAAKLRREVEARDMEVVAYTISANLFHATKEGSEAEIAKFGNVELDALPSFSTGDAKNTFAYFYGETGCSIYYSGNGKTFKKISTECEMVVSDDLLSLIPETPTTDKTDKDDENKDSSLPG